jgi:hypothetical protein
VTVSVRESRRRWIVPAGLVVLGLAYLVRRPLLMAAPACLAGHWHGCYDTENGVLLIMLAGLGLVGPVMWVLPRLRMAEVGMVYGTVPFVWITTMPGPGAGVVPGRLSLIPLRDLATMGPIRFGALASWPRILALGAACSILVETAQYVLRLDRVSSVDDVLVNAVGALLFGLASRRWWRTGQGGEGAEAGDHLLG